MGLGLASGSDGFAAHSFSELKLMFVNRQHLMRCMDDGLS
jgi:hypothetical protein